MFRRDAHRKHRQLPSLNSVLSQRAAFAKQAGKFPIVPSREPARRGCCLPQDGPSLGYRPPSEQALQNGILSIARAQRPRGFRRIWQLSLKGMSNSDRHRNLVSLRNSGQTRPKAASEVGASEHHHITGKLSTGRRDLTLKR